MVLEELFIILPNLGERSFPQAAMLIFICITFWGAEGMYSLLDNIGLFHFSFSIRSLVPLLFTPPSPLIPIYHQPSRVENVFITCYKLYWSMLFKHIKHLP